MPHDPDAAWALDPMLERDTTAVGDLPLSRLLLSRDANYPWLLLVPRRAGVSELTDLDRAALTQLTDEIAQTSRALRAATGCERINVAALGNVVAQLHVHVVARRRGDAAWPKPVWNAAPPRAYAEAARRALAAAVEQRLAILRTVGGHRGGA